MGARGGEGRGVVVRGGRGEVGGGGDAGGGADGGAGVFADGGGGGGVPLFVGVCGV